MFDGGRTGKLPAWLGVVRPGTQVPVRALVAFVVADREMDLDACRRWFADQGVARFKTPEYLVHVDEVPVLGVGKPDRPELRHRAAGLADTPA